MNLSRSSHDCLPLLHSSQIRSSVHQPCAGSVNTGECPDTPSAHCTLERTTFRQVSEDVPWVLVLRIGVLCIGARQHGAAPRRELSEADCCSYDSVTHRRDEPQQALRREPRVVGDVEAHLWPPSSPAGRTEVFPSEHKDSRLKAIHQLACSPADACTVSYTSTSTHTQIWQFPVCSRLLLVCSCSMAQRLYCSSGAQHWTPSCIQTVVSGSYPVLLLSMRHVCQGSQQVDQQSYRAWEHKYTSRAARRTQVHRPRPAACHTPNIPERHSALHP